MNNIKIIFISIAIVTITYFTTDYFNTKKNLKIQKENNAYIERYDRMIRKQDSTISTYIKQTVKRGDLDSYLESRDNDLKEWITKSNDINLRRVHSIIKNELKFKNTDTTIVDLSPILEAIRNNEKEIKIPFKDSISDCMIIKGWIVLNGEKLDLVIDDRAFTNTTQIVAYMQRQEWKFLFFKFRLFGKRKLEVLVKDSCGKSTTMFIDVQNKKKLD